MSERTARTKNFALSALQNKRLGRGCDGILKLLHQNFYTPDNLIEVSEPPLSFRRRPLRPLDVYRQYESGSHTPRSKVRRRLVRYWNQCDSSQINSAYALDKPTAIANNAGKSECRRIFKPRRDFRLAFSTKCCLWTLLVGAGKGHRLFANRTSSATPSLRPHKIRP